MRFIPLTRLLYLGVFLLAIGNCGCAALAIGGAAAAGAAGYAYYRGNVSGNFHADVETTWAATLGALEDLRLPVKAVHKSNVEGAIDSETSKGEKVYIQVRWAPTETREVLSQVGVRIGVFGDRDLSKRILQQIGVRLQQGAIRLGPPPQLGGLPIGGAKQTAPGQISPPGQPIIPVRETSEPPRISPSASAGSPSTPAPPLAVPK